MTYLDGLPQVQCNRECKKAFIFALRFAAKNNRYFSKAYHFRKENHKVQQML
jgi:hypothetical protein